MHKYLKALEDISDILRMTNLDDAAKIAQISEAVDEVNNF